MSKKICFIIVVSLLLISVAQADVNLNISGSQFEIQNTDTFRIRNVIAPGYRGAYWIDFKWDPVNLVFVPVNLGAEALYKIAGYVKTTDGEAISGAAISINTGTYSNTDQNGYYIVNNLTNGTYTVIASKAGYLITPTPASVSLSNADNVQNFTATLLTTFTPDNAIPINSLQEVIRDGLAVGATDLYVATVPAPGTASFQNATRDWSTRRDMLVMYGGAACDQRVPDIYDYNAIMAGINNASLPDRSETGVTINNRVFYYNFQDLMNQGVLIGRLTRPAAPAGCYYVWICNVSSTTSDYSLYFSYVPR